jgi:tetratricopeptide (TPR) repeat protein
MDPRENHRQAPRHAALRGFCPAEDARGALRKYALPVGLSARDGILGAMNTTRKPAVGQGSRRFLFGTPNKNALVAKVRPAAICLVAAILALSAAPVQAADTYDASLKAGDEHRVKKEYEPALAEYVAAFGLSSNDGMKALALGKKGGVYLDQKNYSAAKQAAQEALEYKNLAPVAKVIALQVLGDCQLKDEKDYVGAIDTLEQALLLQGVDWAQPSVNLSLGDSYRLSGKFDKALETYQKIPAVAGASNGIKSIAWLNIGLTYQYNLRDDAQAKAAYKKVVELNPGLKAEVDEHLSRIP